jgi:hypothetical protein
VISEFGHCTYGTVLAPASHWHISTPHFSASESEWLPRMDPLGGPPERVLVGDGGQRGELSHFDVRHEPTMVDEQSPVAIELIDNYRFSRWAASA